MSDFERPFTVRVLPYGSKSGAAFVAKELRLDPLRHTCSAIKDRLSLSGLLVHNGTVVNDEAPLKNWYDSDSHIVVAETSGDFFETDEWAKTQNQLARLLNAGVPIDAGLMCLGRCYWQPGFDAFFRAATVLRGLVEETGSYDYQCRVEVPCLTTRRPNPVIVFDEHRHYPMLPPILRGDTTGGPFLNEWIDEPRSALSIEERAAIEAEAKLMENRLDSLALASKAVVRGFGYHATADDPSKGPLRVVPFTAFFVAPSLLLTARTSAFCPESGTFAIKFKFAKHARCQHGMLRAGEDLYDCVPVAGVSETLAQRIRHIGIALDEAKMPPGMYSCPWNDFLLLEVKDERFHSDVYLLPEAAGPLAKGDRVVVAGYPELPSQEWIDDSYGERGHNMPPNFDAFAHVRRQWWGGDVKCGAVGQVVDVDEDHGMMRHTASLVPGMRGAPVLSSITVPGQTPSDPALPVFAGLCCGRSVEKFNHDRDHIIGMSTSEAARSDSLAYNMANEATSASHLCLVLLYQEYIQHRIQNFEARLHLKRFLSPFEVFVSDEILSRCHALMLRDAEEHNEFGMDFYEHHDLDSALVCFREGAKMFSTASIPNLSEHALELKSALQTNVSAVVVAKMSVTDPV